MLANSATPNERNFINTLLCIRELNNFLVFFFFFFWYLEAKSYEMNAWQLLILRISSLPHIIRYVHYSLLHSLPDESVQVTLCMDIVACAGTIRLRVRSWSCIDRWQCSIGFRACLSDGCHVTVGCVCNRCKPSFKTCHENTFGA